MLKRQDTLVSTLSQSHPSPQPGCSHVQSSKLVSAIHACLPRVTASRLRVPSRVIPLPVAVGGPCSFHTCLYSRHGQHCSSQQPWLRARNTEPTGSVETCNGGTEHLGTAHIFGFLWGISRPPPSCLQLPEPHTIVSASGCVSQGAEPQLACLALP